MTDSRARWRGGGGASASTSGSVGGGVGGGGPVRAQSVGWGALGRPVEGRKVAERSPLDADVRIACA